MRTVRLRQYSGRCRDFLLPTGLSNVVVTIRLRVLRVQIGYLVNTYPRASHSFIRREIQALERMGWQVHRFAMRSDRAALVDAADLAEDDLTEHVLHRAPARVVLAALVWMLGHPGNTLAATRLALRCGRRGAGGGPGTGGRLRHLIYLVEAAYIAQRCRTLAIGHLHAHFGTNSATVTMLAAALGGPGYSFTVHGPEEFDAPLALSLGEKIHRAVFTVAISSFGRSQLCRWAAVADWQRLHVVHCGIRPALFGDPAPQPEGGPHLIAIGRLTAQKGFALLIDAVALAAGTLKDLHLTIVGDGDLRADIQNAINANQLAAQVTLAGWADEAGVRAALANANALVSSSFAEGLPVVVIEAMAAGRPVIATAIAGLPELVTPEVGWLVPAGDAAALVEAIVRLAETPVDQRTAMGNAARNRALMRHDVDIEAAKLSALFAKALRR